MPWFKVLRNARVGKKRYLKGSTIELEASALVGKADNFEACSAPVAPGVAAKPEPKKVDPPKKVEAKPADAPPLPFGGGVKSF